jgi:hypothetical protein
MRIYAAMSRGKCISHSKQGGESGGGNDENRLSGVGAASVRHPLHLAGKLLVFEERERDRSFPIWIVSFGREPAWDSTAL